MAAPIAAEREHRKIREWLAAVVEAAAQNLPLARELAQWWRLVKGYEDTHAGGTANFDAVIGALPRIRRRADAADQITRLREAALADESVEKLAKALAAVMEETG